MSNILIGVLNVALLLSSIFLIGLVLIQRGKGGGLAGAFGGMGGSSAFGAKAGDVFTKVTIRTAVVWFLITMALVFMMNQGVDTSGLSDTPDETEATAPLGGGGKDKAGKGAGSKVEGEPVGPGAKSPVDSGVGAGLDAPSSGAAPGKAEGPAADKADGSAAGPK